MVSIWVSRLNSIKLPSSNLIKCWRFEIAGTSSMQNMRDTYNAHNHTGNQGSPTSNPNEAM